MQNISVFLSSSLVALIVLVLTRPAYAAVQQQGYPKADNSIATKVDTILNRCLARDYSVINGISKISWVNPESKDFDQIQELGESAIPELDLAARDGNDFKALLAIKLLNRIGGESTMPTLLRVVDPSRWVLLRLAAMDGLVRVPGGTGIARIRELSLDEDPIIAQRAKDLLALKYPEHKD